MISRNLSHHFNVPCVFFRAEMEGNTQVVFSTGGKTLFGVDARGEVWNLGNMKKPVNGPGIYEDVQSRKWHLC